MNKNFKQKNERCITQTATDLSNVKVTNELQLILARKIWSFCFWRNMQFKRNIVSLYHITCSVSQSVDLLLIWPAHKSVWAIECFDLSDRSLRILNGLNIAWCFAAVECLFHCLTLYMFHWGMAPFLSSTSAHDGSPVMRGMWRGVIEVSVLTS